MRKVSDIEALFLSERSRANLAPEWHLTMSRRMRICMGVCVFKSKEIRLNRAWALEVNEAELVDVIRHEIAHALVGFGHGHDRTWKLACQSLGARPTRCQSHETAVVAFRGWIAHCLKCGRDVGMRQRKPSARGYRHNVCGGSVTFRHTDD